MKYRYNSTYDRTVQIKALRGYLASRSLTRATSSAVWILPGVEIYIILVHERGVESCLDLWCDSGTFIITCRPVRHVQLDHQNVLALHNNQHVVLTRDLSINAKAPTTRSARQL